MMKKLFATVLCLTLTTPCFAAGRFDNHPQPHQNMQGYRYEQPDHYEIQPHRKHASATTKTFATIAGVAGVAAIISAIVD